MKQFDNDKCQNDNNNGSGNKFFVPSIISKLLFDGFQNWIRNYQHNKNIKKQDIVEEKLIVVENLQVKLDNRVKENGHRINTLRVLLISSMIMNFVFFAVLLIVLIVML